MRYLDDVTTLELMEERCIGCGMCTEVCPHAVLVMDGGKVRIADLNACMECGACAKNCPVDALLVQAGVGCAQAVINSALGRKGSCCNLDGPGTSESDCGCDSREAESRPAGRSGCC